MQELFAFIYKFRVFLIFVVLEAICGILIINNNTYQRAVFLSSANSAVGSMFQTRNYVSEFLNLDEVNAELMKENANLQYMVSNLKHSDKFAFHEDDSLFLQQIDSLSESEKYLFISSKVINNSILFKNNYITINKGTKDGIKPGMGLITSSGLVGQVKSSSDHFSTCYSLLHSSMAVSAQLKKNNALCTVQWESEDPSQATLFYLARHLQVEEGDTVVTSGYNAVYPEGIMVGTVSEVEKLPSERFLKVNVNLSVDFSQVSYVYVVNALFRAEKDSLENATFVE